MKRTRDFTYVDDVVEANLQAMIRRLGDIVGSVDGGHRVEMAEFTDEAGAATRPFLQWRVAAGQLGDVHDTASDFTLARQVQGMGRSLILAVALHAKSTGHVDLLRTTCSRLLTTGTAEHTDDIHQSSVRLYSSRFSTRFGLPNRLSAEATLVSETGS